jgi:hypothetical protein
MKQIQRDALDTWDNELVYCSVYEHNSFCVHLYEHKHTGHFPIIRNFQKGRDFEFDVFSNKAEAIKAAKDKIGNEVGDGFIFDNTFAALKGLGFVEEK